MSEIFFTSDTHFYHDQDFLYLPRNCHSYEEMNEKVIERWNSVVHPNDIVYHLGDVLLGHYDINVLNRLNGKLYLIRGNHDTDRKLSDIAAIRSSDTYTYLGTSELIKFGKLSLFLCHYPVLTANYDEKHFSQHTISLHGHTHQKANWLFADNPFIYHVGLDSHDCYPVHIEEIIADIRNRWNAQGKLNIAPTGVYNSYPS